MRATGSVTHLPLSSTDRARSVRDHLKVTTGRSIGLTGAHRGPPRAADDTPDAEMDMEAAQVDYIYNCNLQETFQATGNGDPVVFLTNLSCSAGTPQSMSSELFQASVDSPYQFFNGTPTPPVNCGAVPSCDSPTFSYGFALSIWLLLDTDYTVVGTDGVVYDLGTLENIQVFNSLDGLYPFIDSTRTDLQDAERTVPPGSNFIPFPDNNSGGPNFWHFCDDDASITVPPACPRDPNFNLRLKAVYANNGWTVPTSSDPNRPFADAHHIKPLKAAGGNNPGDTTTMPNGVLLDPVVHDQFSNWWTYWESQNPNPSDDGEDD